MHCASSLNLCCKRDVGRIEAIRASKGKQIPTVMSPPEVSTILDQLVGVYRIIAGLLYGCGLRISEAISLRFKDIDFDNRLIEIHQSKGDKSRLVPLPEQLVEPLRRAVRSRTVLHEQDLLWSGTDIRTIQELLGHSDVKTTMIYTHVLNRQDINVVSPLDRLKRVDRYEPAVPSSTDSGLGTKEMQSSDDSPVTNDLICGVVQGVHCAKADPPFFDVCSTPPYAGAKFGLGRIIHVGRQPGRKALPLRRKRDLYLARYARRIRHTLATEVQNRDTAHGHLR